MSTGRRGGADRPPSMAELMRLAGQPTLFDGVHLPSEDQICENPSEEGSGDS